PIMPQQAPLPGDLQGRPFQLVRCTVRHNQARFEVWYRDFDPAEFDRLTPEQRFAEVRAALVAGFPTMRVAQDWNSTLHGQYPGRDLTLEDDQGLKTRVRVVLVRPRLYVLMVVWRDQLRGDDINWFFNHFYVGGPGVQFGLD